MAHRKATESCGPIPSHFFLEHIEDSPDCWCSPDVVMPCPQCHQAGWLCVVPADDRSKKMRAICGVCLGLGFVETNNLEAAGVRIVHR